MDIEEIRKILNSECKNIKREKQLLEFKNSMILVFILAIMAFMVNMAATIDKYISTADHNAINEVLLDKHWPIKKPSTYPDIPEIVVTFEQS